MTFALIVWVGGSLAALGPGYPTEAECWAAEPGVLADLRMTEDRPDNPAVISACIPEGEASAALWAAAETASLPNGGL